MMSDDEIMADYLLHGARMLARACPDCGCPLFEVKGETSLRGLRGPECVIGGRARGRRILGDGGHGRPGPCGIARTRVDGNRSPP